jgi:tight adherence protein B
VPVLGLLLGGVVLALAGVAAVLALTAVVVRTAPARRDAAYERDLPELLEQVARHLRSGGSLAQAVAAASPPPTPSGLADEWGDVLRLLPSIGAVAALDRWGASATRPSTRLAAAALAMAADTGGSPARAVDGVAATLRSRLAVADEVRALASQARASSVVIALAPLAFAAFAGATDDRTAAFFRSPAGVLTAAAGLVLDALGAWWMSRLCRPPAAERPAVA